jgi:uncharacterized repeat protein (TIGR01451 family)/CSLREA domain-containing protein
MKRFALLSLAVLGLAGCVDGTLPTGVPYDAQRSAAHAATILVTSLEDPGDGACTPEHCTLREAIAAAQPGDRIEFSSGLSGSVELYAGELVIEKDLTIDGGGRIVVDGRKQSRILRTVEAVEVSVEGLQVTRGVEYPFAGPGVFPGGGIYNSGSLTLRNVVLSENEGERGGAVYNNVGATLVLVDSWVHNNIAPSISPIPGYGGGIYNNLGRVELLRSSVSGNTAGASGGGIYNTGHLSVTASTISGNSAVEHHGGGIWNSGELMLLASTISGNQAPHWGGGGGGIFQETGSMVVRSSTVTANSAFDFGGILTEGGSATLSNSIVAGNKDTLSSDCGGALVSHGYNLVASGQNCPTSGIGDVVVAASQVFTHVLEPELKDNGGPTHTHALIERGFAVDAGYCPGETADQRGFPRPVDDPRLPNARDGCDIGAFEWQPDAQAPLNRADLMVSLSVDKTRVKQGDQLTYYVRAQNLGPESAPNVVVTNLLSSGVTFVSMSANRGTYTAPPPGEAGTVTWYLDEMQAHDNEVAELAVTVIVRGRTTITHTATVSGDVDDPNEANNTASITVTVQPGGGGGGKENGA